MSERHWSVSSADVHESIQEFLGSDRRGVLATIVDVEGNAYRRPGAKMLVDADGGGLGHITAGCLEDDVIALAEEILADGRPRIETYDLMEDEEDVWGLGVGCNGIIDVLLEPIDERHEPLADAATAQEPIGTISVLDGDWVDGNHPLGTKAYYRDSEVEAAGDVPDWLLEAVEEPARTLVADGKSDTLQIETGEGTATVFIDGIQPDPRLVVVGSGHDVGPVVDLGTKNGFRVTVVGFRGAVDLADRFPHADDYVTTAPGNLEAAVDLDERTYAVVMTHNFIDDRLAVDTLVDSPTPYVGLMGPRDRFEEMLEDFEAEGRTFTESELECVYTPVGLDLGAGSPYGIATSIVSEALAVANDREPRHLTEREGPIHDRTDIDVPSTD